MAKTVNVAGLALIRVQAGITGGLVDFGYTQNGATITTEGHAVNVPGDENGGDDGPPIEIQYLGETARIRLEMTKWDVAVGNTLVARLANQVAGAYKTPGTLMFANSLYFRLVISAPNAPWNFPCVTLVRTPIEINAGTKFSRLLLECEAYKNPVAGNGALINVLYNSTIA